MRQSHSSAGHEEVPHLIVPKSRNRSYLTTLRARSGLPVEVGQKARVVVSTVLIVL